MLIFSSCSKNLLYLSDLDIENIEHFVPNPQSYKLQPYDYLDIRITTTDEKLNQLFNLSTQNRYRFQPSVNGQFYFLSGYMVNDSGYVIVPIIGDFKAEGKTVEQFENIVQKRVDSLLNGAYVKVKLISFQVFFVGEVNRSITFYKDRVNILEAISEIGGLPYSADKKHVYVLRRQDSTLETFTLDLTTKHILENQNFFLEPYDIVYVRPRRAQVFRLQTQDYYIVVSLITTTASIISLLLSLKQ